MVGSSLGSHVGQTHGQSKSKPIILRVEIQDIALILMFYYSSIHCIHTVTLENSHHHYEQTSKFRMCYVAVLFTSLLYTGAGVILYLCKCNVRRELFKA